jgi:hypothetical protein
VKGTLPVPLKPLLMATSFELQTQSVRLLPWYVQAADSIRTELAATAVAVAVAAVVALVALSAFTA